MKKMRVAVLGAGAIARASHIPGYAAAADCELCAIADTRPESLAAVREKWTFKREYNDFRELLRQEKPDLVSVCLPNCFHAEAAIIAMEQGANVILEKPVATTAADAEAIRSAVGKTGKRLGVCFSHRFNNMVKAAKQALDSGRIGDPYMFRIRFAHGGPYPGWAVSDWFYDPEFAGGGALLDMGIHAIDLANYFLGPANRVSGQIATLRKTIAVEDNAVLTVRFGERCFGYIECSWTSRSGFSGFEICGDNGSILVDYAGGEAVMCSGVCKPDGTITVEKQRLAERGESAWKCQMAEMIEAARSGRDFPVGIEAGIAALRVALAAYESERTGRRITL